MNDPIVLRRPKLHFDTAPQPSHVTFDDGAVRRASRPFRLEEGRDPPPKQVPAYPRALPVAP